MNDFKISLKAARVNAGLTQAEVSETLHRNKQTIVNWENGKTHISMVNVMRLAELYQVPIELLRIPETNTK